MTRNKHFYQRIALGITLLTWLVVTLQSCLNGNGMLPTSQNLVVVEQNDSICLVQDLDNDSSVPLSFTISIDVPVNGPQVLVDSVMVLVNSKLYEFCEEYSVNSNLKKEELYTDDGKQLLSHYMDKYKPLLESPLTLDSLGSGLYAIALKLEAQTEKYVTYSLEYTYCGAGCGYDYFYYTFDKSDGHQVRDILGQDNLGRFLKDFPQHATVKYDDRTESHLTPEDVHGDLCYGLLADSLSLIQQAPANSYITVEFPYCEILPYLSAEAQQLVGQKIKDKSSVK